MERHPLAEARGESVQAPTTNLPSNDPWRDEESPQTPNTPRLVLECEKPRSAKGHAGKHREKDSRSRWREQPDATTKTETHLHPGPPRTRKPSTPDLDTQTWQTGKTPARHPDALCILHLLTKRFENRDSCAACLSQIDPLQTSTRLGSARHGRPTFAFSPDCLFILLPKAGSSVICGSPMRADRVPIGDDFSGL